MAIAIAAGLISATMLILLVLPCFMLIFDDLMALGYFLWNGVTRPRKRISSTIPEGTP
jgi:hydrophobic/amphiphilic exporter-1 (mainly G- bacteria), HAE1 family